MHIAADADRGISAPLVCNSKDLVYFLILRHPVRCRYCRKRFYVSIFRVGEVRRDARARDVRHESDKSVPKAVALNQERSEDLH